MQIFYTKISVRDLLPNRYYRAFYLLFDKDGHFEESIVDKDFDVEKIIQTQMMIEAVKSVLSKLSDDEREIIDRLYFSDETLRSVAKEKSISHPALIREGIRY